VTAPLDRDGIRAIIPHREPFLLVDEVTELEPGVRAAGRYLVKADEWYLAGHFPGNPIMPGVLQVEALAQLGAVCGLAHPDFAGKLALFAGIDDVRFKRIVAPGDTLRLEVTMEKLGSRFGKGRGVATVAGEVACEGLLSFIIPPEGSLR